MLLLKEKPAFSTLLRLNCEQGQMPSLRLCFVQAQGHRVSGTTGQVKMASHVLGKLLLACPDLVKSLTSTGRISRFPSPQPGSRNDIPGVLLKEYWGDIGHTLDQVHQHDTTVARMNLHEFFRLIDGCAVIPFIPMHKEPKYANAVDLMHCCYAVRTYLKRNEHERGGCRRHRPSDIAITSCSRGGGRLHHSRSSVDLFMVGNLSYGKLNRPALIPLIVRHNSNFVLARLKAGTKLTFPQCIPRVPTALGRYAHEIVRD